MSISLKPMLEGATAIPYSDELIDILEGATLSYKSEEEFARVDKLVVGFVTGNIPSCFKSYINLAIKKQGFNEVPTDDVFVRLAQYVVLNAILDNEDELNQAICASKLMNYMLVAKALKRSIPNTSCMLKAYDYHLSRYLKNIDKLPENILSDLRSEVPEAKFPLEISKENEVALRLVFKEAELYRIERLLTSNEIQNIENPFAKVYVGLSKMFDSLSYYFYNLDLNRIIELLIENKDEKKRMKLTKIIDEIFQTGYGFDNLYSETSVILWMISGERFGLIGDVMLSIKEFAIYLYYELLTENIIATQK